jgi:teichuronic acid biosynthesis glycosyltransferase TuaG
MTEVLISVIIPTFNSAKYIAQTVESVQMQEWDSLEIIIMDDGSTDNTLEILNQLAALDPKIRVFSQTNGKPAKARNNAIRKANGKWIAFIDSDDIWLPEKLKQQFEKTIESSVDLSFTNGYICINNDMNLRDFKFGVSDKLYSGNDALQEFHLQNRIPTSSVLMKRELFYTHEFFPEYPEYPMYCEDYLFWTRLIAKGCRFLAIGEPLFLYRVHPESTIGEEIRLMGPLLKVLLLLPGEKKLPWKTHLEKSFLRYLTILQNSNSLKLLDPFVKPVCLNLHPGIKGKIIALTWHFSPRLFTSLIWRLRINRNRA